MKLGSLFDGSGGFPLAGSIHGIEPVWASEIEPFPIRVTRKNFPDMKHLGDITLISGHEIEPADIITFGSPCQNLSIAGNRKGLEGSRSGLFKEAIRIIEQMKRSTNAVYPRFVVWENVTGAFSSNDGEDFRTVIEMLCRIKDPEISIPKPEKWEKAGCVLADNFSIAWRTLDAQYWGVPQRRKRIFLVADFAGGGAPKILFESESLPGNYQACPKEGQGTAADPDRRSIGSGGTTVLNDQGGSAMSVSEDVTATLRAQEHQHQPLVLTHALDYHPNDSRIGLSSNLDISQTLTGRMGTGGNNVPLLMASGQTRAEIVSGLSPTLTCQHEAPILANDMRIRRLTPLECCRLQGFPDDWCQGLVNDHPDQDEIEFWHKVFDQWGKPKTEKQIRKWLASPHSDAAEYKMWGNGIALPCAEFVLGAIKRYEEESS